MTIKIFKDLKQFTLTSTLTKEDFNLVQKYRPDALKIKNEDGDDVFALSYSEGRSCVSPFGVTFGATSADDKKLMIVGCLPAVNGDESYGDKIADIVGAALPHVETLEKALPDVVAQIKAQRKALIDSITTA